MTIESLEGLRERLLRQPGVQQMIQTRAYEIFQMRGGNPGGEAQDWFHAEGEVLAFLIASEAAQADSLTESELIEGTVGSNVPSEAPAKKAKAARSVTKVAAAKQPSPKKTAPKRAAARKSAGVKSKPTKTGKQSNPPETGR
jgi:Protein of unknown function (DUF2934)